MTETVQVIDRGLNSYIAIDLETTGLDPKRDRVIEIGAVRVLDGQITEELSLFVNPKMTLTEFTKDLTGITDEMVSDAPDLDTLIEDVVAFCGDLPILGHHIIFDYSFLKRAAVNKGLQFEKTGIDTLTLCRKYMPEEEKKNLMSACAYYGVMTDTSHRAAPDAQAAHFLYQALKKVSEIPEDDLFFGKPLVYKVKKEQPATKKQKQDLRDLAKYHRISLSVQIDSMLRNEVSRMTDKIILHYGRIKRGEKNDKSW